MAYDPVVVTQGEPKMTTLSASLDSQSSPQEIAHTSLVWRTMGHQEALRRFGIAITVLTILGHVYLGFEQSIAQPIVALMTAYSMQIFLEFLYARSNGIAPRYRGGVGKLVDCLLPAHIAALAVSMLLYFNDRLLVVAFATSVAIGSKYVFRVPTGAGSIHFLNPSNFGICVTLLLFPSVGLAMPWHWTTELSGLADWLFPVVVFVLGTFLHLKYAARIWVVVSFLITFLVQALIRSAFSDINLFTALAPATGVAAAIFTFYMAPDPATTPANSRSQILFGSAISLFYMILMFMHVVFALFYALAIVSMIRGGWIALRSVTGRPNLESNKQDG
jgi:enediyne biosynthesis protein E5